MVHIKELSVGTKVLIVDKWMNPHRENDHGHMDKYLGTVMTVKSCNAGYVKMEEDQGDPHRESGWGWYPEMLAEICSDGDWDKDETIQIDECEFAEILMGGYHVGSGI